MQAARSPLRSGRCRLAVFALQGLSVDLGSPALVGNARTLLRVPSFPSLSMDSRTGRWAAQPHGFASRMTRVHAAPIWVAALFRAMQLCAGLGPRDPTRVDIATS